MSSDELERIVKAVVKRLRIELANQDIDTEDLVSQGLLYACEQMHKFDPKYGQTVGQYLYYQVHGRLRSHVTRDISKHMYGGQGMKRVSLDKAEGVATTSSLETSMSLMQAYERMDAIDQKIFRCILEGHTYRDIAELMDMSKSGISYRVAKWRKALTQEYF